MSKLYLFNYNNYFNRLFKKESSLADYGTPIYSLTANFNYNDGVDTYHDINYNGQDGDYFIVCDDENEIVSRWFVLENKRNRGGQHRLTLKRDLKVDLYDVWKNKDMIVHRGWPKYFPDPIMFNPEGFSFNQIKEFEYPLMDGSLTPWYVLYFAKNCPNASGTVTVGGDYDLAINTPISESIYNNGSVYKCYDNRRVFSNSDYRVSSYVTDWLKLIIMGNNSFNDVITEQSARDRDHIWFEENTSTVRAKLTTAYYDKWSTWSNDTYFGKTNGVSNSDRIDFDNGSFVIKDSTNALYQITVNKNTNYNVESYAVTTTLSDAMKLAIDGTTLNREGDWGSEAFGIMYDEVTYTVYANQITSGSVNWEINFNTKQNTLDADYNIIAIPKQTIRVFGPTDDDWHIVTEDFSQALLESILRSTYSDGGESKPLKNYIYDVQLLPYCPYVHNCTYDFNDFYGTVYLKDYEYAPVRGLDTKQSYFNSNGNNNLFLLYVDKAQYEFDIEKFFIKNSSGYTEINVNLQPLNYKNSGDFVNYKIDNECRVYRLCSPNYNGLFEFSVAKNRGVNRFNIDVTLRPQNPYIHINPNFKYMYGSDFNDARGLICQGDFSLPIVTDQWQTYEYQNKNYQNIFNRQMENIDFTQRQERIQTAISLGVGALQGASTGAIAGGAVGGVTGAVGGAVVGGIGSAVAGIADYAMLGARQEEQRSFVVDNYNYQLGNVKALAYSINKVTPLTNNNKLWPFLEIYDATSTEKDMLYKKLKYTSFTIEKIDTLSNYGETGILHFFSATPIRLEGADMATHELQELAKELEKGVYI